MLDSISSYLLLVYQAGEFCLQGEKISLSLLEFQFCLWCLYQQTKSIWHVILYCILFVMILYYIIWHMIWYRIRDRQTWSTMHICWRSSFVIFNDTSPNTKIEARTCCIQSMLTTSKPYCRFGYRSMYSGNGWNLSSKTKRALKFKNYLRVSVDRKEYEW